MSNGRGRLTVTESECGQNELFKAGNFRNDPVLLDNKTEVVQNRVAFSPPGFHVELFHLI
jgi:hypothetical protein